MIKVVPRNDLIYNMFVSNSALVKIFKQFYRIINFIIYPLIGIIWYNIEFGKNIQKQDHRVPHYVTLRIKVLLQHKS